VALDRVVPYTIATTAPAVLVAKFSSGHTAAVPAAPAVAAPPAVTASLQAQAPAAPAPAELVAQAPPGQPSRISLEFRATELADVLSALARVCNVNIVTDTSVKGQITVRLLDLTCDEALRFILEANNLGFRRVGRNLIVLPADRLAPPPEGPETISYPIGFGNAKEIADAVRAAVPGIRVTSDTRTNNMVVVGTPAQHEEVRKILASLDVQLVNVMVESRVVDINVDDLRQMGLRWGLTGDAPTNIFTIQGTFPNQITIGTATFSINGALTALVNQGRARVITAPRVAVVNGNEANINLGEEIPIPQTDAAGRVTYTFKPVGVILKITPRVNADGSITAKIEPEVSSVRELLPNLVPRIATRKASTTVTVRNGDSVVLGGLISSEERKTTIKVPILGDIPLVGLLFRYTSVSRTESEVIFVVTPQVLPTPGVPAPAPSPSPRP